MSSPRPNVSTCVRLRWQCGILCSHFYYEIIGPLSQVWLRLGDHACQLPGRQLHRAAEQHQRRIFQQDVCNDIIIEDYGGDCIMGFQRSLSGSFVLWCVFPRVFQVLAGFIPAWLGFCFSDSGRFEVFASL